MHVTLCVYSDTLSPQEISARLGIKPTESFSKGEPITTKRGKYANHRTAGWLLSSRDTVSATDLNTHLRWLLDRSENAIEALRAMANDLHDVSVVCVIGGSPGGGGPSISAETLGRLARLGLPLDFDVYA